MTENERNILSGGVKGIAARRGISCREMARRFRIPYRTMESWSAGERTPPDYILLMMDEILSAEN